MNAKVEAKYLIIKEQVISPRFMKRIRNRSLRSVNHDANGTAGSLPVRSALRTVVRQNNLLGKPTQPIICLFPE